MTVQMLWHIAEVKEIKVKVIDEHLEVLPFVLIKWLENRYLRRIFHATLDVAFVT